MENKKNSFQVEPQEKDKCVLCGAETPYTKKTHIDSRLFYVEGCGQLCRTCWCKVETISSCP